MFSSFFRGPWLSVAAAAQHSIRECTRPRPRGASIETTGRGGGPDDVPVPPSEAHGARRGPKRGLSASSLLFAPQVSSVVVTVTSTLYIIDYSLVNHFFRVFVGGYVGRQCVEGWDASS